MKKFIRSSLETPALNGRDEDGSVSPYNKLGFLDRSSRRLILFFVSVVMAMTLSIQYAHAADLTAAKGFQIKDINGKTVTLSDYKGKKSVFLLFWTTWCPYCRKELKVLSVKSAQLTSADIELLAINIGESDAKVADFLKRNPLNLRVCLDKSTSVAESYAVLGIPTYIIVNKDGFIVFTGHSFPDNYLKLIAQ